MHTTDTDHRPTAARRSDPHDCPPGTFCACGNRWPCPEAAGAGFSWHPTRDGYGNVLGPLDASSGGYPMVGQYQLDEAEARWPGIEVHDALAVTVPAEPTYYVEAARSGVGFARTPELVPERATVIEARQVDPAVRDEGRAFMASTS